MSKHSPEPWKVVNDELQDANGEEVIFLTGEWEIEGWTMAPQDLRRIIACVNACRGIPTEKLEQQLPFAAHAGPTPVDTAPKPW
jgi:hypothetical protein